MQLNLSNNEIGDDRVKIIGEVLKVNTTLTLLNLDNDDIEYNSVREIVESLKVNSTVKELDLINNKVGDAKERHRRLILGL